MPETNKDPIKEAFAKAKQDIFNLSSQIELLKKEIIELKRALQHINRQTDTSTHSYLQNPAQNTQKPAFQHINPAHKSSQTDTSTHNQSLYGLKSPISNFSIGNEGVPADRQTDQQTDNKQPNIELNEPLEPHTPSKIHYIKKQTTPQPAPKDQEKTHKPLERVSQVLESLDAIKKDLRQKFKRLTAQEMAVFSTIYTLEEEGLIVDYSLISQKLSLTQSSIRDYIQRLTKKGIPLIKNKENNKRILVSISSELKKIATLATINQLREL